MTTNNTFSPNSFSFPVCFFGTLTLLFAFAIQVPPVFAAKPFRPEIYTAYADCNWEEITPLEEKIKIYNLINESCESNYSKLSTWQATYQLDSFNTEWKRGDPITHLSRDCDTHASFAIDFSIDFHKDLLNWRCRCVERVNPHDPVPSNPPNDYKNPDHYSYQAIYLPNSQFVRWDFMPRTGGYGTISNYKLSEQNVVTVFGRDDLRPSRFSEHRNDPRFFYCFRLQEGKCTPIWHQCVDNPKILRGEYGKDLQKTQSPKMKVFRANRNEEILYKLSEILEGKPFQDSIHSSKAGFNQVFFAQYDEKNNLGMAHAMEFAEANGVMIPKFYSMFHGQGGSLFEFQLQQSELNEKLPEGVFTLQALGLKDKDIVANYQEKVNYIEERQTHQVMQLQGIS